MVDKNYLKAISCFNFSEYENNPKKVIKFKTNDNLNNCKLTPCQYYTLVPEIAETIYNVPWGAKPFPFSMEVLKCANILCSTNVMQIITVNGEWRRRLFSNALETWWGEWINIEKTIDNIRNDEKIKKYLAENWDRYMAIDKDCPSKRKLEGGKITIDEIVKEIKEGTAKIYRNEMVENRLI